MATREMVQIVFQGVTALTAIGALLFTALSLRATHDQLRINEQGQITERFGRATDQLGSDKVDVRLGAIYSLERLMHDSPGDAGTIVEVLCAFVRGHAPRSTSSAVDAPPHPDRDVQAVLTVLSRRPIETPVDLRSTNLAGADLAGADLAGADLSNAGLTGAQLARANLASASLPHANLTHAYAAGANLAHAWLPAANLTEAILAGANLTGAGLGDADLDGAILEGADVTGAVLARADFGKADLTYVHGLTSSQLADAYLTAETRLPAGMALPSAVPRPN